MKILIADDNKENRYLLEILLKNGGNDVICAENGKKALALLYEQPVGLIISDVLMPEMDGFRLCVKCKNDEKLEKIPIILISSNYISKKDEEFAFMLGAEKFLLRPIEPDALLGIVKEVTDKAKNQDIAARAVFDENTLKFLNMYNDRVVEQVELKMKALEEDVLQRKQAEFNLKERIKELEAYNSLINITQEKNITLDQIYSKMVKILPKSWQYPDIACAKITVNDKEFCTENYKESVWKLCSQIIIDGSVAVGINISYLAEMPNMDEGPFRKEERNLLDNLARLLGEITGRNKAEELIKVSEEKYRTILENVPILQYSVSLDGIILDCNKLTLKILGYKNNKELIGKPILTTIYPLSSRKKARALFLKWKKEGVLKNEEIQVVTKSGKLLDVLLNVSSLYDTKGEVISSISTQLDITEFKKAEVEIISLSKFPEENPNPVGRIDYNGKLLYCNHNCNKKFKDKNFTCNHVNPKLRDTIKKIAAEDSNKPVDVEIVMDDRTFLFTVVPVKEQNYLNFYGKDITDRKKAESLLIENEEKYRSIVETSSEGILIADTENHKFEYSNKAAYQMFGYTQKELSKMDIAAIHPKKDIPRILSMFQDQVSGKYSIITDIPCLRKDGTIFYADINTTQYTIDNRNYAAGFFHDTTERKEAKKTLEESYKKTTKLLEETIKTLATIVEIRDPYTAGHQQRVSQLATLVAKEMGLKKDRIDAISTAATIHDIGKINIAASILSKPGKISDIEYEMIKTHPEASFDMIKNIDFTQPVANIILQHHERINGSGYPKGLKGDDIMLEAKIIAVADIVEAMASHRPYRPALGIDQALEEIEKNRAILYDSEVVDACSKVIKSGAIDFS